MYICMHVSRASSEIDPLWGLAFRAQLTWQFSCSRMWGNHDKTKWKSLVKAFWLAFFKPTVISLQTTFKNRKKLNHSCSFFLVGFTDWKVRTSALHDGIQHRAHYNLACVTGHLGISAARKFLHGMHASDRPDILNISLKGQLTQK